MQNKKFGALSSSIDPEKLSASVSGAILSVSALIIMFGGFLGVPLTQNEVATFASTAGLGVGSLWFLYGVLRKIIVAVNQRFFI